MPRQISPPRHPFLKEDYGKFLKQTDETVNFIIDLLVHEFSTLVGVEDKSVIRKVVALDHIKGFESPLIADMARVNDQREFELEAATLVVQMWADTKRKGGWSQANPFEPSALKNAYYAKQALQAQQAGGRQDSVCTLIERDNNVFTDMRAWLAKIAGLEPEALYAGEEGAQVVNYKPLQSLWVLSGGGGGAGGGEKKRKGVREDRQTYQTEKEREREDRLTAHPTPPHPTSHHEQPTP